MARFHMLAMSLSNDDQRIISRGGLFSFLHQQLDSLKLFTPLYVQLQQELVLLILLLVTTMELQEFLTSK